MGLFSEPFLKPIERSNSTMRAESVAYMIYWEGPEYHEYVMHIFYLEYSGTPKYRNMLGNSLPDWASWSCPRNNRKLPKIFGLSTIKDYVMHNFLHEVFPGIFQVIISNGMVLGDSPNYSYSSLFLIDVADMFDFIFYGSEQG